MIELIELENGNLQIRLTDREEFELLLERQYNDERAYLTDMLDNGHYIGNNWEVPTEIGLTEVPAIGYGMIWNEESGNVFDWEKLWVFDNYMIDDYLQELNDNGSVIFKKI